MSKNIIQLNEEAVKGELKELVRKSVGLSMICYTRTQKKDVKV